MSFRSIGMVMNDFCPYCGSDKVEIAWYKLGIDFMPGVHYVIWNECECGANWQWG